MSFSKFKQAVAQQFACMSMFQLFRTNVERKQDAALESLGVDDLHKMLESL